MASKLRVALVLVFIGAISGFLIWGTNELTFDGIIENRQAREESYYKEIFTIDDSVAISFTVSEVSDGLEEVVIEDTSGTTLGYIYKQADTNAYGNIIVLVGIDTEGVISNVIIASSTNTPTYVKDVKDDNLPNLANQSADQVSFDGTTSATFTYGSIKKVVNNATTYFAANRGDE